MGERSADSILLEYAETIQRLASAPSQNMVANTGHVTALFCSATRGCPGSPRLVADTEGGAWRCSACRRLWVIERADLSRGEIGGRVVGELRDPTGRGRGLRHGMRLLGGPAHRGAGPLASSRATSALGDLGQVLDQVAAADPHAFAAWRLHVLDDEPVQSKRSTTLGLELDRIGPRLAELIEGGLLPATEHALTLYRVRLWIASARRRAVDAYSERLRGCGAPVFEIRG